MIISISNSINASAHRRLPSIALSFVLLSSGMAEPIMGQTAQASPAYRTAAASGLLAALQVHFDNATHGGPARQSRMTAMPGVHSAGVLCGPAELGSGAKIRMVLPPGRKGVLAALTPDGALRVIYSSYGRDTDPEDLIIPSHSVDWARAQFVREFQVDTRRFEALDPAEDAPKPLFTKPGLYQLALLNSIDRDLLAASKTPFLVKAGCVVRWRG